MVMDTETDYKKDILDVDSIPSNINGTCTLFTIYDDLDRVCPLLSKAVFAANYLINMSDFSQILFLYDQWYMHFRTNATNYGWPGAQIIFDKLHELNELQPNWFGSEEYKNTILHTHMLKIKIQYDHNHLCFDGNVTGSSHACVIQTTDKNHSGTIYITDNTITFCKKTMTINKDVVPKKIAFFSLTDMILHKVTHI